MANKTTFRYGAEWKLNDFGQLSRNPPRTDCWNSFNTWETIDSRGMTEDEINIKQELRRNNGK